MDLGKCQVDLEPVPFKKVSLFCLLLFRLNRLSFLPNLDEKVSLFSTLVSEKSVTFFAQLGVAKSSVANNINNTYIGNMNLAK